MTKIARDRKDAALKAAALRFERAQRTAGRELGVSLAESGRLIAAA